MIVESSTTGAEGAKAKTKARKRYLERKKERRKLREKQKSNATDTGNVNEVEVPEISDTRNDHKLSDVQVPIRLNTSMGEVPEIGPAVRRAPTLPLPIFPLPALPTAPSKSALALQGLDRALIDAVIVDPDMVLPIPEGADDGGSLLSEQTRKRLHESGITELFAVQASLLPFLIPPSHGQCQLYLSHRPFRDVCVSAPTGSGKTLAYVLPIIEILSSRIVTHLRALIVLPTRDLVTQVQETFRVLGKGRGLKIGTATGQHSFAHEQVQLVGDLSSSLLGGSSKLDVLICTPGRLIDHLNSTPNFTLQHLRFLVIDEADRLLAQSFQDWLAKVLSAIRTPTVLRDFQMTQSVFYPRPDTVAPNILARLPYPHIPTFLTEAPGSSCQKLLFSATLTHDPAKIAGLQLKEPKYFVVRESKDAEDQNGVSDVVMERFSVPSTLQENMIVCESSQKPLTFFQLVLAQNVTNAIIFTKSAESTTRLVQLFDFFQKEHGTHNHQPLFVVCAYSSDLPVSERKTILERFKAQEIDMLVCSDLISRGIDISHVSHVVSYDAPIDMRKYVHRVGRTARAGRTGCAWTLVEEQEAHYFKSMLKEADHSERVKRLRVGKKDLAALVPAYEVALRHLRDAYIRT